MDFLNTIFRAIISPDLQRALLPIKLFLLVFSSVLICSIIYFLIKSSYLNVLFLEGWREYRKWKQKEKQKRKKKFKKTSVSTEETRPPVQESEFQGRTARTDWERILDKINTDNELNWKLGLIDANKLFDKTLADQGKEFSSGSISNFKEINKTKEYLEKVLENPEASIDLKDAKKIIGIYEKALKEAGAIKNES
jgi:hypothetical protein